MAGGEWICPSDDRTPECEVPRPVSEAPAGGEGGWTGFVEVSHDYDPAEAEGKDKKFP